MGRVLRHIFEPISDPQFHAEEAPQLERTLMAFMPLLIQEQSTYGMYCAALGMCSKSVTFFPPFNFSIDFLQRALPDLRLGTDSKPT